MPATVRTDTAGMTSPPPDRRHSLDPRTIRVFLSRVHIAFGIACIIFPGAFNLPVYSAFRSAPTLWGALCIALGVGLWMVRGSRARIVLNIISAFVLIVIAGAISTTQPNTGTLVYLVLAISSFEGVYLASRDMYVRRAVKGQHGGR